MARSVFGGRATCESRKSIDIRRFHREGRLHAGRQFSWSWTRSNEPSGSIEIRSQPDALVLIYRWRSCGTAEWETVVQRVPITWTACYLGGQRPWFVCSCERRVAVLYGGGRLFNCRHCYGLAYASQRQTPRHRGWEQAQKIRMKLGGSANLLEPFPERPKRMHRHTYLRLRAKAEGVENHSHLLVMRWFNRSSKRRGRPVRR